MKLLFAFALSVLSLGVSVAQTVPNGGFENWAPTRLGYADPEDWFTSNFLTSTVALSAEMSPSAHSGNAALALINPDNGFGAFAITIFPSSERPVAFKGFYRYLPSPGDTANISVLLSRWDPAANTTVVVGGGELNLGNASATGAYDAFNMPIEYFTADLPDTISIIVMASGMMLPLAQTTLFVDDLQFEAAPVSAAADAVKPLTLNLYPNPASGACTVQLDEQLGRTTDYRVVDIMGRVVQAGMVSPEMQSRQQLNIDSSRLAPGVYQVLVTGDSKAAAARLVVSR